MDLWEKAKLITNVVLDRVSHFVFTNVISSLYIVQHVNNPFWVWNDGRTSIYPPEKEDDFVGCWFFDPQMKRFELISGKNNNYQSWPWVAATVDDVDISEYFGDLHFSAPLGQAPPHPLAISAWLMKATGKYIGIKAKFSVTPLHNVLHEKRFRADLDTLDDIESWLDSFSTNMKEA